MDQGQFNQLFSKLTKECFELLDSKGQDYANEDKLDNFKRVTAIAKLYHIDFSQPYHYALLMVLMKLERLQNLRSQGKTPKHESVQDTVRDAINYLYLTYACLVEKQ